MNWLENLDSASVLLVVLAVVAIKSTLLAVIVWLGIRITRTRSSTAQHQAAVFVLLGMLLMPVMVFFVPTTPLPKVTAITEIEKEIVSAFNADSELQSEPVPQRSIAPEPNTAALQNSAAQTDSNAIDKNSSATASPTQPVDGSPAMTTKSESFVSPIKFFFAAYLIGVATLLGNLLMGWLQCNRITSNAIKVQLPSSLHSPHTVVASNSITVPVTIGILKPKIVLPSDWETWNENDLRMAIVHESSHIRRRDTLTTFVAAFNCAVYWFHPLSWILKSRLANLAEHVCDDAVIQKIGARADYAQCLLRMASRLSESSHRVSLGAGMARKAFVESRVNQILDSTRVLARRRGPFASVITFGLISCVTAFAAGIGNSSSPSEEEEPVLGDTITGIVLMPDGSPAVNVKVFLSTWVPPSVRAETKTNQNGQFVFTDFPDGVHRIIAKSGKLSSTQRWGGEITKVGDTDLTIHLGETSTLKVMVVDSNTLKPIPEAIVEVSQYFKDWQQTANDSGTATFSKLPRENWGVTVKAKGFALKEVKEVVVSEADTQITVSLSDPGADLFGTVTNSDGEPLRRADVLVSTAERNPNDRDFNQWVRTDKKGNYRFSSLPIDKKLKTRVVKDGYVERESSVMLKVNAAGEQQQDFTLQPIPVRTITGIVTDSAGHPIAGVTVSSRDPKRGPKATTDYVGRYELIGQLDRHIVQYQAKGFVPQQLDIAPEINKKTIDVKLSAGRRITGKVVNSRGMPLSGVVVRSSKYADVGWITMPWGHCKTDAAGVFAIDSLPDGAKLKFSKEGYSSVVDVPFPEEGDKLAELIQLLGEGIIRGKVVDKTTGDPVTSFRVHYTWSKIVLPHDPPTGTLVKAAHRGDLYTNLEGTFEMDGFRNDFPLQVTVEADGYQKFVVDRLVAKSIHVVESELIELERVDPNSLTEISGRIVDATGNGIAGVEVRLIASAERNERDKIPKPPGVRGRDAFPYNWTMIFNNHIAEDHRVDQFFQSTTDKEGMFSFSGVQSKLDIEVAYWSDDVARGRRSQLETLSAKDQQSLTIAAVQSGTVRGAVNIRANRYASPSIRVGRISYDSTILNDGKTYEIKGVPPGEYEVCISGNRQPSTIPGYEDTGGFTTSVIERIPVTVKSGEVSRADSKGTDSTKDGLTEDDLTEDDPAEDGM